MAKKNEIVKDQSSFVVADDDSIDDEMIPYILELDKITNPNCKLCQSEHREFAENMYDNQRRKNYTAIKNKLKEEFNFDVSGRGVRNHILYHYKVVQKNLSLKEYASDVKQWVDRKVSKAASLKARIGILEREIFYLAEASQDSGMIERRKNAETIKKLTETILACENKLEKFKEHVKPVNIIFNQLKVIVNDEMQNIDSIEFKRVLGRTLTRLKDSVGDLIIE